MTKAEKKYRVAVVGCGKAGALFEAEPKREKPASHAGAVSANNKTELIALVDINIGNLKAAHKLFPRTKCYTSLTECLKTERPDIVIIATPPTARLSLLKECARFSVRMVVCEKPIAASTKEAKRIEAFVAKSGVTFILNYQRRFSPLFARVRANIRAGTLGRIQQVTCYYSNGLYSNGGHIVDALSYLIDDSIVSVVGFKNSKNKTLPVGDVNVDALLTTKKGTRAVLQSFDQKEYGIHDIRIYGTKGSVTLTDYGMTLTEVPARPSQFAGVKQLNITRSRSAHMPLSNTKYVLAHAIRSYEKGSMPASSVTSGLSTLRILDAIAESARHNGRKVAVQ